jgi:hypothetical protein
MTAPLVRFVAQSAGTHNDMIAAALAMIVLGVALLFVIPLGGVVVGIVGVVLLLLFVVGVGRRTRRTQSGHL